MATLGDLRCCNQTILFFAPGAVKPCTSFEAVPVLYNSFRLAKSVMSQIYAVSRIAFMTCLAWPNFVSCFGQLTLTCACADVLLQEKATLAHLGARASMFKKCLHCQVTDCPWLYSCWHFVEYSCMLRLQLCWGWMAADCERSLSPSYGQI